MGIGECEISISNDFIIARKDFQSKGNTLFARSWYNHDILVLGSEGHEQCDDEDCGCLTHTIREIKIGRLRCKRYGRDAFYEQSKKNKQKRLRDK
ncbi:MAG: hypothetical protein CME62_06010 [Halobacteriovoraceae bacterium]|nr:hypothetical protein [Halobacteriovoraceae bacterium]